MEQVTQEEIQKYPTAAERMKIFADKYIPKGYFMKIKHTKELRDDDEVDRFEAIIYKRNEDGSKTFMGNGFAEERRKASAFNELYSFASAQTKARSQALASLGILVEHAIATQEEILEKQQELKELEKKEKNKKVKVDKPSVQDTLRRLRLKFEEDDKKIVITSNPTSEKTIQVIERYGFSKVDEMWVKEKEEEGKDE